MKVDLAIIECTQILLLEGNKCFGHICWHVKKKGNPMQVGLLASKQL